MNFSKNRESQRGFTLLLAALVASITLSLGAAIYSIAIKQVALSSIGRDSQFAFYAADTIAECALYHDIRLGLFPTSSAQCIGATETCPIEVSCNGQPAEVSVERVEATIPGNACTFGPGGGSGGQCSGSTFVAPSDFTQMRVYVYGAGGGGGGGAMCSNSVNGCGGGKPAQTCTALPSSPAALTTFDPRAPLALATLSAGRGGGGAGSGSNCPENNAADGGAGSAAGGTIFTSGAACAQGGICGGSGGNNEPATWRGGYGGNGGYVYEEYTPATMPPGSIVDVVVAAGLVGGASGGGLSSSGAPGSNGLIRVEWDGSSTAWDSTEFTFQLDYNNDCTRINLTKRLVGGYVQNTIHADGLNVNCASQLSDPHSLQRSVELRY